CRPPPAGLRTRRSPPAWPESGSCRRRSRPAGHTSMSPRWWPSCEASAGAGQWPAATPQSSLPQPGDDVPDPCPGRLREPGRKPLVRMLRLVRLHVRQRVRAQVLLRVHERLLILVDELSQPGQTFPFEVIVGKLLDQPDIERIVIREIPSEERDLARA